MHLPSKPPMHYEILLYFSASFASTVGSAFKSLGGMVHICTHKSSHAAAAAAWHTALQQDALQYGLHNLAWQLFGMMRQNAPEELQGAYRNCCAADACISCPWSPDVLTRVRSHSCWAMQPPLVLKSISASHAILVRETTSLQGKFAGHSNRLCLGMAKP